jgi:Restriction endonuclease S subunits
MIVGENMTNEIRQRIDMINHGEVPRGYIKAKSKILPSDWKYIRLGTVLEKIGRRVAVSPDELYKQIGIRSHGKGLFYKEPVSGKELGNKAVFWIEKDCFIVNIVFAWEQAIGRTTDNEVGMIGSHRFPMYRPIKKQVSVDYLIYYFNTKEGKDVLENASPGGAGRNRTLGQKEFLDSKILCPSFFEQEKIAEILTTCDHVIELREKLIAQKQAQKKWIMQNLLTGKKRLRGFTGEWKKVKLEDVSSYKSSSISATSLEQFTGKRTYPVYDANSIFIYIDSFGNADDYISIVKDGAGAGRLYLCKGKSSVIGTMGYINSTDKIGILFLFYRLCLIDFNKYINGSTIPHVYYKDYKNEIINLPSFSEQTAIANILSTADRETELLQSDLNEWKSKKKALMQLLLTGKARVNV